MADAPTPDAARDPDEGVEPAPGSDSLDELLRGWGSMIAARAGLPEGRLAEGFRRVVTT